MNFKQMIISTGRASFAGDHQIAQWGASTRDTPSRSRTISELCVDIGHSESVVYRWMKDADLKKPFPRNYGKEALKRLFVSRHYQGFGTYTVGLAHLRYEFSSLRADLDSRRELFETACRHLISDQMAESRGTAPVYTQALQAELVMMSSFLFLEAFRWCDEESSWAAEYKAHHGAVIARFQEEHLDFPTIAELTDVCITSAFRLLDLLGEMSPSKRNRNEFVYSLILGNTVSALNEIQKHHPEILSRDELQVLWRRGLTAIQTITEFIPNYGPAALNALEFSSCLQDFSGCLNWGKTLVSIDPSVADLTGGSIVPTLDMNKDPAFTFFVAEAAAFIDGNPFDTALEQRGYL